MKFQLEILFFQPSVIRSFYRARHVKNTKEIRPLTLKSMLNQINYGIDQAVNLLVEAYQQQQKIVIVGDFDADGAVAQH